MLKSLMAGLVGLSLATAAVTVSAAEEEGYVPAQNAVHLNADDSKINVTEVFWYGCPHCYALEGPINEWVTEQPEDVEFRRLPAVMGESWRPHAQAYFAAETLGIVDEMHEDFFNAIHQEHRPLTDPEQIADFFTDYGVSKEDALKALDSFGVRSQLNRSQATTRNLQLLGVPALIVDGRYIISPSSAGSLENMLLVASHLVEQVREERASQQEADQQEADQQEASQQEASQQEASQQEADQQEADQQEADQQEADQQEADQQEADQQEADQQEASQQEASQQEADQQEASQQEADQQEANQKEADQKEASQQEASQQKDSQQEAK